MNNVIKKNIVSIVQNVKWYLERMRVQGYPRQEMPKIDGKVMFVVPHADDELISSWKTLLNLDHCVIFYCGMTGSNSQHENKEIRRQEIKSFAQSKGIRLIEAKNWENELIDAINSFSIEYLFLPSFFDWHPEHRRINRVLIENYNNICRDLQLFWYSVTVPIQSEKSVICVLSRTDQAEKYRDFSAYYKSQSNMPILRLKYQERINAKGSLGFAAEVFLNISMEEIKRAIEGSDEVFLNSLKGKINDLYIIRCISSELYLTF